MTQQNNGEPAKLTSEERLTVENIYLKLVNCQLRVQALDKQKADTVDEMKKLQSEMETQRAALSAKYGVDISRTSVAADGTIQAPPPAARPRPVMAAALVQHQATNGQVAEEPPTEKTTP